MNDGKQRVLVIGLDAFEFGLAEKLMGEGRLKNLSKLIGESALFKLHHDDRARFTGLGWEHFSTGKGPEAQQRWSAVNFDPKSYTVQQTQSPSPSFLAASDTPAVVFDLPYFDLEAAKNAQGLTRWGAHDPGSEGFARPGGLRDEVNARFGPYPAGEWIYGFTWPSADKTRAAGAALSQAVSLRGEITNWLLAERLPDWQLAVTVVSETHSAIEQFWHGVDADHPLHGLPSGEAARDALIGVYEALDAFIADLSAAFPDALLMAFSIHGMGPNTSDLPAMFLLPELLYRDAFARPYARERGWAASLPDGTPLLAEGETWDNVMREIVPWPDAATGLLARLKGLFGGRASRARDLTVSTGWMPATRYASFWPTMPAFAMPAYYDAWVRINLAGREQQGLVSLEDYPAQRQRICDLLRACRDVSNGKPAVEKINFPDKAPHDIGPTEADIYVTFAPNIAGLHHPELGTIGPVPYRRTGGHTGDWGVLFARGAGIPPGARGEANAFDVAQTLIDLLGEQPAPDLSGQSLTPRLYSAG